MYMVITSQVISVGTVATLLPGTPLVGRKYISVQNVGAINLFIGGSLVSAGTSATGGVQVQPTYTWYEKYSHSVNIYGITSAGTINVVVEEGK